jgi:hypothetical protein
MTQAAQLPDKNEPRECWEPQEGINKDITTVVCWWTLVITNVNIDCIHDYDETK